MELEVDRHPRGAPHRGPEVRYWAPLPKRISRATRDRKVGNLLGREHALAAKAPGGPCAPVDVARDVLASGEARGASAMQTLTTRW